MEYTSLLHKTMYKLPPQEIISMKSMVLSVLFAVHNLQWREEIGCWDRVKAKGEQGEEGEGGEKNNRGPIQ